MPAGVLNIYIEKGSTWSLDLVVKDGNGLPRDFSHATGKCEIRASASSTATQDVAAAPEVSFPPGVPGGIHLELTEEQTRAIPTSGKSYSDTARYFWDLEVSIGGKVSRLVNGEAKVSPEVTK